MLQRAESLISSYTHAACTADPDKRVKAEAFLVCPSAAKCDIPTTKQDMPEEDKATGEMRVDPQRAQVLAENVGSVLQKISGASNRRQVWRTRVNISV